MLKLKRKKNAVKVINTAKDVNLVLRIKFILSFCFRYKALKYNTLVKYLNYFISFLQIKFSTYLVCFNLIFFFANY